MSNRVRIFLFTLTVGLATAAPVAAASANKRESRRGHARAEHFHAIGRRDLAIGVWTGDRRVFGSASARWSRVLSDEAMQSSLNASTGPFGFGSALVASAPVGNGPDFTAVDPATHTLYVTNGFNANGNADGGNTVSVIDERHCQADEVSRCEGPWPTLTVGSDPNADPSAVAIDRQTDTLYVADANDNTVAVFNGATCNALDHAGCGQTPATVPVGAFPVQIFADPDNHTVYVATVGNNGTGPPDLSMIDSATCNATDLAACPTTQPPTVNVVAAPNAIDVDLANHTVYVTVFGVLSGWTVFDADTCNATDQNGCGDLG
jgi:hypothetical protein